MNTLLVVVYFTNQMINENNQFIIEFHDESILLLDEITLSLFSVEHLLAREESKVSGLSSNRKITSAYATINEDINKLESKLSLSSNIQFTKPFLKLIKNITFLNLGSI